MGRVQAFTVYGGPNKKGRIVAPLPSLNEYVRVERSNRFAASKMKKAATEKVVEAVKEAALEPVGSYPVKVRCLWVEPNSRKDRDNVRFAIKYVLDGLVSAGVLRDDGPDEVEELSDTFAVNKANPRVYVEIEES